MTAAVSPAARLAGVVPAEHAQTVTIASGGAFVRLRGARGARGGGVRGVVRGFSRQSRKRLIDLIYMVDRGKTRPPLFVTLTYPREWPEHWREHKRHLDNWLARLRRRYPGASVLWRLEYQKRGAPHYHVLVFGVPFIPHRWVARTWFEVVQSGDDRHLGAGTQTARVHTWQGAAFYCAKYLGKRCEYGTVQTGRMWGVRGKLPIALETVRLSPAAWFRVRRVLRRFYEKKTGRRAWWCAQTAAGITAYLPERDALRVLAWAVAGA